jgi:hypothetical protein
MRTVLEVHTQGAHDGEIQDELGKFATDAGSDLETGVRDMWIPYPTFDAAGAAADRLRERYSDEDWFMDAKPRKIGS